MRHVSTAIVSSNLNLNPQPDPHNPLQINVRVPTPTIESRRAVVQEASKAADTASDAVKNARGTQQKLLNSMKKSVRPDDVFKAGDEMEKVVEKGKLEVQRIADAARKVLESS